MWIKLRQLRKFDMMRILQFIGMVIGLTAVLMLGEYVYHDWSYDKQHVESRRIYRLTNGFNGQQQMAITARPIAKSFEEHFPEVEKTVRTFNWHTGAISIPDTEGAVESQNIGMIWADSSFLDVFSFHVSQGAERFGEPGMALLTVDAVKRLFGSEVKPADVIGRMLSVETTWETKLIMINGIIESPPTNSTIQFDIVGSMPTIVEHLANGYGNISGFTTYLNVSSDNSIANIKAGLDEFEEKYLGPLAEPTEFGFQPLREVYFTDKLSFDFGVRGNRNNLWALTTLLFLILAITVANFINLTMAIENAKLRQYALMKLLGLSKGSLYKQVISITAVRLFAITASSGVLYMLLEEPTKDFIGRAYSWPLSLPEMSILMILFWGLLTITCAIYPLAAIGAIQPLAIVKAPAHLGSHRQWIAKSLLWFQFVLALLALQASWGVADQFDYINSADLGFKKEGIISVRMEEPENAEKAELIKARLLSVPGVVGGTITNRDIFDETAKNEFQLEEDSTSRLGLINYLAIDWDFFEIFGVQLLAGRQFDRSYAGDQTGNIMVNAKAAKMMGFNDPQQAIGKAIARGYDENRRSGRIVGVFADYHYRSLHQVVEPLILLIDENSYKTRLSLAFVPGARPMHELLSEAWDDLDLSTPMRYAYLDDHIMQSYEPEYQLGALFKISSGLLLLMTILGIAALANFTVQRSAKSIGIKKILGATFNHLLISFNVRFLLLIALSALLAIPLAYYWITDWYAVFEYHVAFSPWIPAMALFTVGVVCVGTISASISRAVLKNPSETLRSE